MADKLRRAAGEVPEATAKVAEETNPTSAKKDNKKLCMVIGAAIVIIIAILIGINIYNSPQRRLERLLNLGNTYLDNGQYEEAALTFEQAIAIDDRCVEAYAGGVEAYINLDDTAGMTAFYNKALTTVEGLDEGIVTEKVDYVAEIYLAADNVYSFDKGRAIETLEQGYRVTNENVRVKESLVNDYIAVSKSGEYEERLAIFDRLLELDGENEEVQQNMKELLTEYIGVLIEEEDYDKIGELTGQYEGVAQEVVNEYVDQYIEEAQGYTDEGAYEESEAVYDILFHLDGDSDKVQTSAQDFLQQYIDSLIAQMQYDDVRKLIDKYRDLIPGMDFDAILAQIEAMEAEAARIAEEEEQARLAELERETAGANETSQDNGQTAQGQQSRFSYDEIPFWILSGERTAFTSGVASTWTAEQAALYDEMWLSVWGWDPGFVERQRYFAEQ